MDYEDYSDEVDDSDWYIEDLSILLPHKNFIIGVASAFLTFVVVLAVCDSFWEAEKETSAQCAETTFEQLWPILEFLGVKRLDYPTKLKQQVSSPSEVYTETAVLWEIEEQNKDQLNNLLTNETSFISILECSTSDISLHSPEYFPENAQKEVSTQLSISQLKTSSLCNQHMQTKQKKPKNKTASIQTIPYSDSSSALLATESTERSMPKAILRLPDTKPVGALETVKCGAGDMKTQLEITSEIKTKHVQITEPEKNFFCNDHITSTHQIIKYLNGEIDKQVNMGRENNRRLKSTWQKESDHHYVQKQRENAFIVQEEQPQSILNGYRHFSSGQLSNAKKKSPLSDKFSRFSSSRSSLFLNSQRSHNKKFMDGKNTELAMMPMSSKHLNSRHKHDASSWDLKISKHKPRSSLKRRYHDDQLVSNEHKNFDVNSKPTLILQSLNHLSKNHEDYILGTYRSNYDRKLLEKLIEETNVLTDKPSNEKCISKDSSFSEIYRKDITKSPRKAQRKRKAVFNRTAPKLGFLYPVRTVNNLAEDFDIVSSFSPRNLSKRAKSSSSIYSFEDDYDQFNQILRTHHEANRTSLESPSMTSLVFKDLKSFLKHFTKSSYGSSEGSNKSSMLSLSKPGMKRKMNKSPKLRKKIKPLVSQLETLSSWNNSSANHWINEELILTNKKSEITNDSQERSLQVAHMLHASHKPQFLSSNITHQNSTPQNWVKKNTLLFSANKKNSDYTCKLQKSRNKHRTSRKHRITFRQFSVARRSNLKVPTFSLHGPPSDTVSLPGNPGHTVKRNNLGCDPSCVLASMSPVTAVHGKARSQISLLACSDELKTLIKTTITDMQKFTSNNSSQPKGNFNTNVQMPQSNSAKYLPSVSSISLSTSNENRSILSLYMENRTDVSEYTDNCGSLSGYSDNGPRHSGYSENVSIPSKGSNTCINSTRHFYNSVGLPRYFENSSNFCEYPVQDSSLYEETAYSGDMSSVHVKGFREDIFKSQINPKYPCNDYALCNRINQNSVLSNGNMSDISRNNKACKISESMAKNQALQRKSNEEEKEHAEMMYFWNLEAQTSPLLLDNAIMPVGNKRSTSADSKKCSFQTYNRVTNAQGTHSYKHRPTKNSCWGEEGYNDAKKTYDSHDIKSLVKLSVTNRKPALVLMKSNNKQCLLDNTLASHKFRYKNNTQAYAIVKSNEGQHARAVCCITHENNSDSNFKHVGLVANYILAKHQPSFSPHQPSSSPHQPSFSPQQPSSSPKQLVIFPLKYYNYTTNSLRLLDYNISHLSKSSSSSSCSNATTQLAPKQKYVHSVRARSGHVDFSSKNIRILQNCRSQLKSAKSVRPISNESCTEQLEQEMQENQQQNKYSTTTRKSNARKIITSCAKGAHLSVGLHTLEEPPCHPDTSQKKISVFSGRSLKYPPSINSSNIQDHAYSVFSSDTNPIFNRKIFVLKCKRKRDENFSENSTVSKSTTAASVFLAQVMNSSSSLSHSYYNDCLLPQTKTSSSECSEEQADRRHGWSDQSVLADLRLQNPEKQPSWNENTYDSLKNVTYGTEDSPPPEEDKRSISISVSNECNTCRSVSFDDSQIISKENKLKDEKRFKKMFSPSNSKGRVRFKRQYITESEFERCLRYKTCRTKTSRNLHVLPSNSNLLDLTIKKRTEPPYTKNSFMNVDKKYKREPQNKMKKFLKLDKKQRVTPNTKNSFLNEDKKHKREPPNTANTFLNVGKKNTRWPENTISKFSPMRSNFQSPRKEVKKKCTERDNRNILEERSRYIRCRRKARKCTPPSVLLDGEQTSYMQLIPKKRKCKGLRLSQFGRPDITNVFKTSEQILSTKEGNKAKNCQSLDYHDYQDQSSSSNLRPNAPKVVYNWNSFVSNSQCKVSTSTSYMYSSKSSCTLQSCTSLSLSSTEDSDFPLTPSTMEKLIIIQPRPKHRRPGLFLQSKTSSISGKERRVADVMYSLLGNVLKKSPTHATRKPPKTNTLTARARPVCNKFPEAVSIERGKNHGDVPPNCFQEDNIRYNSIRQLSDKEVFCNIREEMAEKESQTDTIDEVKLQCGINKKTYVNRPFLRMPLQKLHQGLDASTITDTTIGFLTKSIQTSFVSEWQQTSKNQAETVSKKEEPDKRKDKKKNKTKSASKDNLKDCASSVHFKLEMKAKPNCPSSLKFEKHFSDKENSNFRLNDLIQAIKLMGVESGTNLKKTATTERSQDNVVAPTALSTDNSVSSELKFDGLHFAHESPVVRLGQPFPVNKKVEGQFRRVPELASYVQYAPAEQWKQDIFPIVKKNAHKTAVKDMPTSPLLTSPQKPLRAIKQELHDMVNKYTNPDSIPNANLRHHDKNSPATKNLDRVPRQKKLIFPLDTSKQKTKYLCATEKCQPQPVTCIDVSPISGPKLNGKLRPQNNNTDTPALHLRGKLVENYPPNDLWRPMHIFLDKSNTEEPKVLKTSHCQRVDKETPTKSPLKNKVHSESASNQRTRSKIPVPISRVKRKTLLPRNDDRRPLKCFPPCSTSCSVSSLTSLNFTKNCPTDKFHKNPSPIVHKKCKEKKSKKRKRLRQDSTWT